MAKHLTDSEVEKIVDRLTGWKGRLTWELLADACEPLIGRRPIRQVLARSARVSLSFRTVKARLRANAGTASTANPEMAVLLQRIDRLEARNAQLSAENAQLLEQFVRWQYNAFAAGLAPDRLNEALPPIDLRPTR